LIEIEKPDLVARFLKRAVHKESTRRIYANGLKAFEAFYQKQGTVNDFMDRLDADLMLPYPLRKGVARDVLSDFIADLKEKKYSPKTISTYVNALRALVSDKYDDEYSMSIRNSGLPDSEAESDKQEWNLELISEFFLSFDNPLYQTILAVIFQSGLGIGDVLALTYSDIQEEFEAGIVPILLTLKRHKTDVEFTTFLGKVTVDQIRAYFKLVGTPSPESKIFQITKGSVERFFARKARKIIRKELKKKTDKESIELLKAENPWKHFCPMRPHSLRAAFQKLLVLAGCPEILSEFWMGHETEKQKGCYILKGMGPKEHREQYVKFYDKALAFKTERSD
jgi:integrase